ncbi:MAG: hypothetical protein ABSD70_14385 [Terracidiphilus sp.]
MQGGTGGDAAEAGGTMRRQRAASRAMDRRQAHGQRHEHREERHTLHDPILPGVSSVLPGHVPSL